MHAISNCLQRPFYLQVMDQFHHYNASSTMGGGRYPVPPPDPLIMYRDFSRYDYSHGRDPIVVPHVREYEHGLLGHGVPVFDPRIPPPPIVQDL